MEKPWEKYRVDPGMEKLREARKLDGRLTLLDRAMFDMMDSVKINMMKRHILCGACVAHSGANQNCDILQYRFTH
jgi:hypothetical protein